MLSSYGKREWATILIVGIALMIGAALLHWWWVVGMALLITLAGLSFFRDPIRQIPSQRGIMVSPADGRVSSIHEVEHFEPLGESALCIRIFLSVLNVHVNRSPCHGQVADIRYKPGEHLNALNVESALRNEANLVVFVNPTTQKPVAAVNQIAGLIARRIVCGVEKGDILQRGQRFGLIKFGSTTELYIPMSSQPRPLVTQGQPVHGGTTVLAQLQTGNSDR